MKLDGASGDTTIDEAGEGPKMTQGPKNDMKLCECSRRRKHRF